MISCARFVFALHALASVATVFLFYATVGAQTNPTLPQATVDTTYSPPTGGTTWTVNAGGNLQTAINNAQRGDIIELAAGATFTGNFVLPAKSGSGWIYIRSSAYSSLPAPGTRISPSDAKNMAKIQTTNIQPALRVDFGANHYRIIGLEITTTWTTRGTQQYQIIQVGYNSSSQEPSQLSQYPTNITFDRVYIHGTPTGDIRDGLLVSSQSFALIDSHIDNIHVTFDEAHGIQVRNLPGGGLKIDNNRIECSGINVFIGDNSLSYTPSDVSITRNHLFKPLSWKSTDPSYAGIRWLVKNLLELKAATRVLIEGNILENSWMDSQAGFLVVLTPRGGNVSDVTFRRNILRGSYQVFQINSAQLAGAPGPMKNLLLEDNLIYNITYTIFDLGFESYQTVNMIWRHNTVTGSGGSLLFFEAGGHPAENGWYVYDNLFSDKAYGIMGTGTARGLPTVQYWSTNYDWNNNVIIGASQQYGTNANFRGFLYAANNAAVGFTNTALANPADFRLTASSPYKGKATDGKDIGADIDALLTAVQLVTSDAVEKF